MRDREEGRVVCVSVCVWYVFQCVCEESSNYSPPLLSPVLFLLFQETMFRVLSRQVSRVDTVPHTGSRTPRWMSFSSSSDSSNSSSRGGGGNEIDVGSRNTFASPIPSPMPSSSSPSSSSLPSSSSMFASGGKVEESH